jgi:hypothetical protein
LAFLVLVQCASSEEAPPAGVAGSSGARSTALGGAGGSSPVTTGGLASTAGGTPSVSGGTAGANSSSLGGAHAGSAGSANAAGGALGGSGGVNAAGGLGGGAGATMACAGTPIVPDAGGFVAPGSNPLGIHGSWFVYSDCPDQKAKGLPCSTVTAPPANTFPNVGGKLCTSGMTAAAAGAWGAGIALELNDKPPQQPYDTVAHGVRGFCLVLSGPTLPSTGLRVAFPTQNVPDDVYFETVSTPGAHTVLFADTAQGSWVTKKVAFEPTKVMLLQLQIPSSPSAPVAWDFCVEGLTAITQ